MFPHISSNKYREDSENVNTPVKCIANFRHVFSIFFFFTNMVLEPFGRKIYNMFIVYVWAVDVLNCTKYDKS